MSCTVVVGAQWGDEAKGKVVDFLADGADLIVRYCGGTNAGHTVVVGEEVFKLRNIPSGVLWPNKLCVISDGALIDPEVLAGRSRLAKSLMELGSAIAGPDHVVVTKKGFLNRFRRTSKSSDRAGKETD